MFRANAIYEGEYLLGTSIARPLIAKRQIEIATRDRRRRDRRTARPARATTRCASSSASTRWSRTSSVIAPWREWDLLSREKLLAYADRHGIPIENEAQAGGAPVLDGRQPAAHQLRRAARSKIRRASRRSHVALDRVAGKGAGRSRNTSSSNIEHGDIVAIERQADVAGARC